MSTLRKIAIVSLFSLGLLLFGAAAPASAKSIYGDLYLGFSLEGLQGMPEGFDLGAIMSQGPLPFRAKVYFQDGLVRIDVDLPSLQGLAAEKGTQSLESFQVLTLLVDMAGNECVLLNHDLRKAYRIIIPEALMGVHAYKDPFALLTSKEYIASLTQSGLKHLGTKRIKSRSFEGVMAAGLETQVKMSVPKDLAAQFSQMGADFSGVFKLRYFYEPESKFPLLYEMDSGFAGFTMQIVNIKRDRLPEVMFQVPPFYVIKDFSVEELERMFLELASTAPEIAGQLASQSGQGARPPVQAQPDGAEVAPAETSGSEEAAEPAGADDNSPKEIPPGAMGT